jgi:hypothetical protein
MWSTKVGLTMCFFTREPYRGIVADKLMNHSRQRVDRERPCSGGGCGKLMLRTTRSRYPVFLALSFVRRFRHSRDLFLYHSLVQRLMNGAMLQGLDSSLSSTGWLVQGYVIDGFSPSIHAGKVGKGRLIAASICLLCTNLCDV